MSNYDQYYLTKNFFGKPYPELVDFFRQYEPKGKLLDLGCGQGRNSIPLAKMGYSVTGIDNSNIGINQMLENANKLNLEISALTSDFHEFDQYGNYDIVLLDSIFHFYKGDLQSETGLITKIIHKIKKNGLVCLCIQDSVIKVKILNETIVKTEIPVEIITDKKFIYQFHDKQSGHKSKSGYRMLGYLKK